MKKVFYTAVKTEEDAARLSADITARTGNVPDFYGIYIDSGIDYNTAVSKRRRYKAMMNAVRRGKIDTILIRSMDDLLMSEMYACAVFLRLKEYGVSVIVGKGRQSFSTGEMSEHDIIVKMNELYYDYLMLNLTVPVVTLEKCVIHSSCGSAWLYLKEEKEAACARYPYLRSKNHMSADRTISFIDAVTECMDSGFYFYRKDADSWYFIDPHGMEFLKYIYEDNYQILLESLMKK